ncbi:MAG: histidine kinase N-terminal 7TM domain-containing protein [Caldilineaceae bacterium]
MLDLTATELLSFFNVALSSVVVILAFSLLAYTLTYNFRSSVARWFAFLLFCVALVYSGDVALDGVVSAESAARWLRLQWLGIALLPASSYQFSAAVLRTTNFRLGRRALLGSIIMVISGASAILALFTPMIAQAVHFKPPISYLEPGPLFWPFAIFFILSSILSMGNIWKARQRSLAPGTRKRMTYLFVGIAAPSIGTFPYLIVGADRLNGAEFGNLILLIALIVNTMVAVMLPIMSYSVAYFGVLTPDRVVRYRMLRFFIRGPVVAILVILAILTIPKVETLLGLPRDVVLFSVIVIIIVSSQLALSVTKSLVDRLVYREDREEIAWLRELDRRLLTTTDLRQYLDNNLVALCEFLRVSSGFVAAVSGADLVLESVVGPSETRHTVTEVADWNEALSRAVRRTETVRPLSHRGFWVWPLLEPDGNGNAKALGLLGVQARTEAPVLSPEEGELLGRMVDNVARALMDRQLQRGVFVVLQRIIPDVERIQQLRHAVPYSADDSETRPADALLNPSPIHSPEFEAWVKDALRHYWGGPKLSRSPLVQLRIVDGAMDECDENPTKALRQVLESAITRMKPDGAPNLSRPEWLLYNILDMRFIQGRRVREIADRLAISESDLYRKQRIAVGQVAQVLAEMERQDVPGQARALRDSDDEERNPADEAENSESVNSAERAPLPEKEM